jgi:hypothetical protein
VLADEHPELVARLVIVEAALAQGGGSISPWIAAHGEARFVEHGHGALLERFDGSGRTGSGPAALHAFFARTPPFALYRMARAWSNRSDATSGADCSSCTCRGRTSQAGPPAPS